MLCGFNTRLHDLFIEKAELQESLESVKIEFEERMKSLVEENDYLSELVGSTVLQSVTMNDDVSEQSKIQVHARQIKLENDENAFKMKLEDVDKEKQGKVTVAHIL